VKGDKAGRPPESGEKSLRYTGINSLKGKGNPECQSGWRIHTTGLGQNRYKLTTRAQKWARYGAAASKSRPTKGVKTVCRISEV